MTDEKLAKLKRMYHRPAGVMVPVEIRIISDLIDEVELLKDALCTAIDEANYQIDKAVKKQDNTA